MCIFLFLCGILCFIFHISASASIGWQWWKEINNAYNQRKQYILDVQDKEKWQWQNYRAWQENQERKAKIKKLLLRYQWDIFKVTANRSEHMRLKMKQIRRQDEGIGLYVRVVFM